MTDTWTDEQDYLEQQASDHHDLECLDDRGDGQCRGAVNWHTVGSATRAFPRCDYHFAQRMDRYENSIERWADSDVAPSWFDPTAAGERWDEDY